MELDCAIQNYAWGKLGKESFVAKLYGNVHPEYKIQDKMAYAEFWMGTHPNAPSVIRETGQPLSDFIKKNPECLGKEVQKVFGNELPYLFKVLSINTALSIQVHPNKVLLSKV